MMYVKHLKNMDCCIRVDSLEKLGNGVLISGTWHNMGFEHNYSIGSRSTFKVLDNKVSEWFYCEAPQAITQSLRSLDWVPLAKYKNFIKGDL